MSVEESLHDMVIRERQLEEHLLRSTEYLKCADQNLKRQVSMLYLAIALLLLFQVLFSFRAVDEIPHSAIVLVSVTSILAIVNCLLLIRTKTWLQRLNEAWLDPRQRDALEALKSQRQEILSRHNRSPKPSESAESN
jgi:hypothetical protein